MMEEGMSIKGSITLVLAKPTGEVEVVHKDNIIVNGGFDFVADAIGNSGSRPGVMGWIAVGTGTTAAANKRSPKRRQPADANSDPAKTSPTAAATPPKRRLNKKLVVDEDSDNESEPRDVELTPLALYAQARAALAEPDINELPRKAATDNGDAASDPK
jgi:hypothetical protein